MRLAPPLEKAVQAEIIKQLRTIGASVHSTSQARASKVAIGGGP